jgi:hypothetical protein
MILRVFGELQCRRPEDEGWYEGRFDDEIQYEGDAAR